MTSISYACRNFYRLEDGSKYVMGYIDVYLKKNIDIIELKIMGLQENGDYMEPGSKPDHGGQANVIVKYPINACIYNLIMIIFDKLTKDHKYSLQISDTKTHDVIICSDDFIKKYPEKCNYNIEETFVGGVWIPFNLENIKYLDCEKDNIDECSDNEFIILQGKVDYDKYGNLEFKYDTPIISNNMSKEYYEITRGNRVWDIIMDKTTGKYKIEPFDA